MSEAPAREYKDLENPAGDDPASAQNVIQGNPIQAPNLGEMNRTEDSILSTTSSDGSAAARTQRVIAVIESQASQSTNTHMATKSGDQAAPTLNTGLSNMPPSEGASTDKENLAGNILSGVNHPHPTQPPGPGVMQNATPVLMDIPDPVLPAHTSATRTRQEDRPRAQTPTDVRTQDEIQRVPNSPQSQDENRHSSHERQAGNLWEQL